MAERLFGLMQKLGAGGRVGLEHAAKSRSGGGAGGIHHTAGFNAVMHRIHFYRHIFGFQQGLQRNQYLLGQALLHLWPLGKETHYAIDLRQADDLLPRR